MNKFFEEIKKIKAESDMVDRPFETRKRIGRPPREKVDLKLIKSFILDDGLTSYEIGILISYSDKSVLRFADKLGLRERLHQNAREKRMREMHERRERGKAAIRMLAEGDTQKEIAQFFGETRQNIYQLIKMVKREGL